MPTNVPTVDEFNALTARVTALENANQPQPGQPSKDGTKVTDVNSILTDDNRNQWKLVGPTANLTIQWMPAGTSTWLQAGVSSRVVLIEKYKTTCYQSNQDGGWWAASYVMSPPSVTWNNAPGDPTSAPPTGQFTVTANGFTDPTGATVHFRGLNGSPQDLIDGFGQVFNQFPHMNIVRMNCDSGQDQQATMDDAVNKYTGRKCVVVVEDHGQNKRNTAWYQQYATKYAHNAYVFMGTPNEPGGDVTNDQIAVINTIRGAGFNNPVGIQCRGGYDFGSVDGVLAAVGKQQLYMTPHIYYAGSDPNGSQQYIDNDINACHQRQLWCEFYEFGDGMDGWHRDQYGLQLVRQVIAAQQAGRCGAIFWAMDNNNHPDGCCSAFLTRDGSQLTNPVTGVDPIKPWLS